MPEFVTTEIQDIKLHIFDGCLLTVTRHQTPIPNTEVPALPMPYHSPQTFPLFTYTIEFTNWERIGTKKRHVRPFFFLSFSFFPLVLPILGRSADNCLNTQDNPIYVFFFPHVDTIFTLSPRTNRSEHTV